MGVLFGGSGVSRRKSNRTIHTSPHRDILDDLETSVVTPDTGRTPVVRPAQPVLKRQGLQDRREWAPGRLSDPPRDFAGRTARVVYKAKAPKVIRGPGGKPLQSRRSVLQRLDNALPRFAAARTAVICLRRKVRREILHALRQTRAGAGKSKRRNEWSDVKC